MGVDGIGSAIQSALNFLGTRQMGNGEFPTYVWTDRTVGVIPMPDSTLMSTISVLYSLSHLQNASALDIMDKGCNFLVSEMEEPGYWRFWTAKTELDINLDLDDTCLASFLLRNRCLPGIKANVNRILTNQNEDGLFFTWFRPRMARNDIDSVVNANALLYVGERPETSAVCRYLSDLVLHDKVLGSSHYYPGESSFYYALSRSYRHGVRELGQVKRAVISKLRMVQHSDGSFGDSLATAQACCALLNFGYIGPELFTGLQNILKNQRADGSWPLTMFWAGPEPPEPHSLFWGAEEITTALSIECLTLGCVRADEDAGDSSETFAEQGSEKKGVGTNGKRTTAWER